MDRVDRHLTLIRADEREAIKKDVNDAFIRASGSCARGLSQRLRDGRADARHPIGNRPVDIVADLIERDVDPSRLAELGRTWKHATDRLIAIATGRRSDGEGRVA